MLLMSPEEFNALYQRHSREVWAVVYARRIDRDLALDITQEAFLRLWRQSRYGAAVINPRAWLLRVARNLAEDHAKSAFHRNGTHPPQSLTELGSREPAPLKTVLDAERLHVVREALSQLPDSDRELLTLRYALDYSTQQIAEVLGISASAVHMRLTRARQRMAKRLTARGAIPNEV